MKHATHLSVHTPHSPPHPSSSRSHTLSKRFHCLPYPYTSACPIGFSLFGTWSVVKTLENKFPIKQVSAVAAESSQADRTGLAKRPPTVAASQPRGLHISLMLLMRKGQERVSGALGVHRVRDTAMRARAI